MPWASTNSTNDGAILANMGSLTAASRTLLASAVAASLRASGVPRVSTLRVDSLLAVCPSQRSVRKASSASCELAARRAWATSFFLSPGFATTSFSEVWSRT